MTRLSFWFCLLLPAIALALPKVQVIETGGPAIWLVEDRTLPMMEVRLWFDGAGYASDPAEEQGRAALATALLGEGAGARDAAAFQRALDAHGIRLSADLGRDGLLVGLTTLTEHRDVASALLADMLLRPAFNEDAMARIKARMAVQRARAQESPRWQAERAYQQAAYGEHPYANHRLGSNESVEALSRDAMQAYMQQLITLGRLQISISGAISARNARALVQPLLDGLPAAAEQQVPQAAASVAEPFEESVDLALPQTQLLFARPGLSRADPDFYAAHLLNHIVGGGSTLTSRLGDAVRKQRGLTYGIGTALEPGVLANRWVGTVATQASTAAEAKEVIESTLARIADEGVSAEELRTAKDYVIGAFPLKLDRNAAVAGYLLSMQRFALGQDYLSQRNAYFESVTLEQVNRLAADYLPPEHWSWVEVGPAEAE